MDHTDAIRVFVKTLHNLEAWMDKAAEYAASRSFDVDVLVQARLAPDQFSFAQQVQAGCDQVKYAAAYLSGRPAPSHPDTEKTFAELRQRIRTCLAFVESVPAAEYAGGGERKVAPSWLRGSWLTADDYMREMAIPNFYFHVTMAYAILRHNGVALGKMDYIGSLPIREG